jgi:hypothetical protein
LCWWSGLGGRIRDEQCHGCRKTRWAWSLLSCGSFSPSSVLEMMGSSIVTTATFCQGRTHGSLFHLSVHDVIADFHTYVITKTPMWQLLMLTQRYLVAHCLIKIEGHYSCERNPVLSSVGVLQSWSGNFLIHPSMSCTTAMVFLKTC